MISHGDQHGVGRSAPIVLVLFAPLCGEALVLILMLGLAFVPASIEDRSDHLLTGGVVHGDVEQVAGGTGLQVAKLVDQGLIGCPGEECADDVHIDDIGEGVALLGEPADVIPQGLAGLLLAALEVLGVTRVDIHPLEISNKDPLDVRPVTDAIGQKEFKPCPNMLPTQMGRYWMMKWSSSTPLAR